MIGLDTNVFIRYIVQDDEQQAQSAMISRIIKQAVSEEIIRPYDPDAGTKAMRYIPFWA